MTHITELPNEQRIALRNYQPGSLAAKTVSSLSKRTPTRIREQEKPAPVTVFQPEPGTMVVPAELVGRSNGPVVMSAAA